MMFTQRSILNRDSTDEEGRELNRTANIRFGGLALIYTI